MRSRASLFIAFLALAPSAAGAQEFHGLGGSGANDVWAVGVNGIAARFTGRGWVAMRTGTTNRLRAVWSASPTDVWAVGDDNTILHLTGNAWAYVRPPVRRDWFAVAGCGPNDVWIIGQSDADNRSPTLLHWNGSEFTIERAPIEFRAAAILPTCITGAGGGGSGGISIVGSTYWDPRPEQRRYAGVLMRRSGSGWVTLGSDGRTVTDPQIGGAAWSSASSCGAHVLLGGRTDNGQQVILVSRGSGWATLPAPTPGGDSDPESFRYAIGCDGVPLVVHEEGFGRFANNRWAFVGKVTDSTAQGSLEGGAARLNAIMQRMQAYAARGQQPPQSLIDSMMRAQQAMQGGVAGVMANSERENLVNFGRQPVIFTTAGAAYTVGAPQLRKLVGDSVAIVWSAQCHMPGYGDAPPCGENMARGERTPTPVTGAPPASPDDVDEGNSAAPSAPAKANPTNRPRGLPSLPRIRRP